MVPEKPWSRLHLDQAINFEGTNWLVVINAYSKYPCIHPVSSTSTKATTELLKQDFAPLGHPHMVQIMPLLLYQKSSRLGVSLTLSGAQYHPATNGATERLVQTFKCSSNHLSLHERQLWNFSCSIAERLLRQVTLLVGF